MDQQKISEFKQFMAEYWPEYLPQSNDMENVLTYTYDYPGEKPSTLTALILFVLGVIPGILYLVLGGKKPERYIVNFNLSSNILTASGEKSDKILKSYQTYQVDSQKFNIKKYKTKTTPWVLLIIIWGIIILAFLMTNLN